MKGLDNRSRDQKSPKAGEIRQKRRDTLNKNLPRPIPQFSPNASLDFMRQETGNVRGPCVGRLQNFAANSSSYL